MARVLGDRITLSLALMLVVGGSFYLWTAATTYPLSLASNLPNDYYNELAKALLHLHLAIAIAPPGLLHLPDPYEPSQNAPYQSLYHDLSLYHGKLYLDWGPAPVVVLLVPLQLVSLSASPSLTVALLAIVGLAFALGTLRVLLRHFDSLPLWMGTLAAAVLVCSTAIPFLLRRPAVYEEAIAGGFCFAMAGVYVAVRTIAKRDASCGALALMSLCFGLAAGSRPTLVALGLLLVPVYLVLRTTRPHKPLLLALAAPFGMCLLLLLAYNVVRFGNPLEVGQSYNLAGYNPRTVHLSSPSFIVPNLWYYLISPPRPTILFPFLVLAPPPFTYPLPNPAGFGAYGAPEITGGLLVMTPLLLFALALPWLLRRRRQLVEPVTSPLLIAAGAGLLVLLFLSYEFYGSTERYEVDFAGVFLLAALAGWFALSNGAPSWRRKAIRILGATLAVWGCFTGIAISFTGYYELLRAAHPGTWRSLEEATSPISTAIAAVAGHPVLARVEAPYLSQVSPVRLTTIGAGINSFSLPSGYSASLTIVSPDRRTAAVVANLQMGPALHKGAALSVLVHDASSAPHGFSVLHNGPARVPVELNRGLNRVVLTAAASAINPPNPTVTADNFLLVVSDLTLAAHY
jgi:hypothetical protein